MTLPSELIEASAGTGKTQALAERLISLLRLGVKPQEIVALTFSRAAAGEIFERFVSLLSEYARKDKSDAARLREAIASQHLSQIGTLDSFLMRITRSFPLELGLAGELEMMDEYTAAAERARISFSILRRTDAFTRRNFTEAFALAMNRENTRSFVDSYRKFIGEWHERIAAMPQASAWGEAASIWGMTPAFTRVTERELAAAADAIEPLESTPAWQDFVSYVRNFRGVFGTLKGVAKKLIGGEAEITDATVSFELSRHAYTFGGESAKAVKTALAALAGYVIRMKLELARGVYRMISVFEKEYDQKVRRTGRLVFADVPRLICSLGDEERLAIEYRLDSRIKAWALDEFQDTSREQWKAMSNLIEEAKQSDGEKSVFIVGDVKQAIYGWRNGDVGIFRHERESGEYKLDSLHKSWRFGSAITDAVNQVFMGGFITNRFPAWKSPKHESAHPERLGYVQSFDSPGKLMDDFVAPVANALRSVDPIGRGISAAVLVRGNTFGQVLADGLKAAGVKNVVWEGESAILDTPALSGFLDLVQLADHPGDMVVYRHFRLTPLARTKYPDGVPSAAEISGEMSAAFSERGLVRVFRELRSLFPDDPDEAWSGFTDERFTDMLKAAAEFELSMEAGTRLSDFAHYLESRSKRSLADPGNIRIMTIHRSKGLGFDYVVLPLYEHQGIDGNIKGPLIGDGWILPDPGEKALGLVEGLSAASDLRRDRSEQEALATYYVAMTRAKTAMTIIRHPVMNNATSTRFSDIVRASIAGEIGDREWYSAFSAKSAEAEGDATAVRQTPARRRRESFRRRLPSQNFHSGMSASVLFAPMSSRRAAIERGEEIHAQYEQVEFLECASNGFERALLRPEGFTELWRERAFEIAADGEWISGRFDRVVFTEGPDGRAAVVQDYKTNSLRPGESAEAFAKRLRETYASQLASYCRAVFALTGISPGNIRAELLATAINDCIQMDGIQGE